MYHVLPTFRPTVSPTPYLVRGLHLSQIRKGAMTSPFQGSMQPVAFLIVAVLAVPTRTTPRKRALRNRKRSERRANRGWPGWPRRREMAPGRHGAARCALRVV